MKLSIIIPAFNEQSSVAQILSKVNEVKLPNADKEIIVVNDGSSDNTDKILTAQKIKFKYLKHKKNLGKGAAIRTGIKVATGNIVLIQDADLEYNPQDYLKLLEPILENKVSVVYGTRLANYPLKFWGKDKTVLPTHLLANKFLTLLTNLLYSSKLTDMETGYKVFKKEVLDSISIKSNKFDFEAEVTIRILKKNIKILEIPIITQPRGYNEGKKIGWKDGVSAVWTLIKYKFTNR